LDSTANVTMRVFVTGIAGFIGSHVAEHLIATGASVEGCDDLSAGRAEHVPAGASWQPVRAQDVQRIDADVVVHLAGIACARWPDPLEVWNQNLGGTAHTLRLVAQADARTVLASTAAAAPGAVGAYGASKYAAERLTLAQGGTVLRFANVYGPRQRDTGTEPGVLAAWARAVRERKPLRLDGDGTQTRDFIHVDDVARAVVAAIRSAAGDGRVLDVCTGEQTAIKDAKAALYGDWPTIQGDRHPDDPDAIVQDPEPAKRILGFTARQALLASTGNGTPAARQRARRP
jgi:UDP-glucose 4-epimerase